MNKNKSLDLAIVIGFLIIAPTLSIIFKTNLLISILLFYGLPSIWLSFREPKNIKRVALFSLVTTILFFILDYVAVKDGAWWVSTIFNFRFFDILPIEDSIWFFLGVYTVVLFYKHFSDHRPHKPEHTHFKYLLAVVGLLVLIFITNLVIFPQLLIISYAYFWIGLIFGVLPVVTVLLAYPALRYKFLKTQIYIFCLHLSFELVALRLGQWSFPGDNFIGWVQILNTKFPLEEFIIWISMTAVITLAYYEFYIDDQK